MKSLLGWIPGCELKKCIERRQSCKLQASPFPFADDPTPLDQICISWSWGERLSYMVVLKDPNPYHELDVFLYRYIFSKTIGVFRFTPKLCPFAYRATAALLQTSLELSHGLAHAMLLECKWAGRKRGNERKKLVVCACGYKEGRCRYRLLDVHHLPLTTKFFRILYDQALTRKEDLDPKRRSFVPLHPENKREQVQRKERQEQAQRVQSEPERVLSGHGIPRKKASNKIGEKHSYC